MHANFFFRREIAARTHVVSAMSMTDKILQRHSISRHQSLSVKLRGAYHGCVSSHD
jgi:hypothetical protein